MKTDEIRRRYLRFFADRGAAVVASDSLVPANDPTLLFTGAGMNQFKDQFMGLRVTHPRAATCQKCLRTGDIMNVGVTPAHHTFFEMLGNFSFGDYFKREAISWAWEFLTGEMAIDPARLQVTVHQSDDEAYAIWEKEIGLPPGKISRLGDHDNFWPADAPKLGPNGPCGPCSEIFYDRGARRGCGRADCGVTCDCRRWVEIWNLVFTQFDRQSDGSLKPLGRANIDTGMGLERMASCLQDADTNMDIDIFAPLLAKLGEITGQSYRASPPDPARDVLMRRVVDHARAVTFCIADGVLPSNTHRGYVLKRLLRRAALDGRSLGAKGAFLCSLVPVVADVMKEPYPDLPGRAEGIAAAIRLEEEKFLRTLDRGLSLLAKSVDEVKAAGGRTLPGPTAFELHDTYGFPYELAEELAEREGLAVDRAGFDEALAAARQKARDGAKMKGEVFAKGPLQEVKKFARPTEFLGYDTLEATAKVVAVVVDRAGEAGEEGGADAVTAGAVNPAAGAKPGDAVTVVLDRTPFYGESGGQVGDTGLLVGGGDLAVRVEDARQRDGLYLHIGVVESGTLAAGDEIVARVDADRRLAIARNHTATHLLHAGLRAVLGDKAEQQGSHVDDERLRFDFRHGQALAADQRRRVEEFVNERILDDLTVGTEVMGIDAARAAGVTALFGEKYGGTVRVVRAGDCSAELCGGTHMKRTAPIGSFRIVAEEAVAAGVRRIEGVTGLVGYRYARGLGERLAEAARELNVAAEDVPGRVLALRDEIKRLNKQLADSRAGHARERLAAAAPVKVGDAQVVAARLDGLSVKELAEAAEGVRKRLGPDAVVALAGEAEPGKAAVAVAVGAARVQAGVKAGDLVKKYAPLIGGGGGGRPDAAQAGGKNPEGLAALLEAFVGFNAEC